MGVGLAAGVSVLAGAPPVVGAAAGAAVLLAVAGECWRGGRFAVVGAVLLGLGAGLACWALSLPALASLPLIAASMLYGSWFADPGFREAHRRAFAAMLDAAASVIKEALGSTQGLMIAAAILLALIVAAKRR